MKEFIKQRCQKSMEKQKGPRFEFARRFGKHNYLRHYQPANPAVDSYHCSRRRDPRKNRNTLYQEIREENSP